jgi:ribose transport system ATP-binding protein
MGGPPAGTVQSGGPSPAAPVPAPRSGAEGDGEVVLEVAALCGGPLRGVDLTVRRGEVVGVAGLVGSGRTSLLKTVFGEHAPASGEVRIASSDGRRSGTPARMAAGVAYVPEDRGGEAAFADLTLRENLSATVLKRYYRPWGMSRRRERADAAELVRAHSVRAASTEVPFTALSGGNQQKAVLARWLRRNPSLLLLDEPTQGVDVMSRNDIYRTIRDTAARGCAVVVASSDLLELCALCDRVVVLRDGRIATSVTGGELTVDRLTELTQTTGRAPSPAASSDRGALR